MKTMIVARNNQQAKFYADDNNLKREDWIFASSSIRLKGFTPETLEIIVISRWHFGKNAEHVRAMSEEIHSQISKGIKVTHEDI